MNIRRPSWLGGREDELEEMEQTEPPAIPTIALLPHPTPPDEETRLRVISQAHSYVEQIKVERANDRAQIDTLHGEIAELVLMVESEKRKNGVLEADLAELHNTITTLQSQVEDYRRFLSLVRQCIDKWDVKPLPKKERKPRKEKHPPKALPDGSLPGDAK
jgi:hypothetical protein